MSESSDSPPKKPEPITYVLAGSDDNGALTDTVAGYEKSPNVIVLRVEDYPSLKDAIAQIKGPANIILACHGEAYETDVATGTFTWNKSEDLGPSYKDFFSQLKTDGSQTIGTISVLSCYGGTALEMLEYLPSGTILQSLVSAEVENLGLFGEEFQTETIGINDPTSLILEALDNVNPAKLNNLAKVMGESGSIISTADYLPNIIGIGGTPPKQIYLEDLEKTLGSNGHVNKRDFNDAIKMVSKHFDLDESKLVAELLDKLGTDFKTLERASQSGAAGYRFEQDTLEKLKEHFPKDAEKINEETGKAYLDRLINEIEETAQKELENKIKAIATKMKNGEPIELDIDGNPDFDELRIRRALGVAYLKTSGELDKMIEQAKQPAQPQAEKQSMLPEHIEAKQTNPEINREATSKGNGPDFGALLGKYGLSKEDFKNVALDNNTPTYAANKQPAQGQGMAIG